MQAVDQQETISAIATGVGAGIGIVRLSGATALAVATKVFRSHRGKNLSEVGNYQAVYGHIADENGNVVDEAIALVMRSPHSYTVEDVVELQCHGGQAVLRRVLQLTYRAGARPAERGEFTKRAFLNGRLDLAQAQSVMDVVGARTDLSLQAAEARLSGRLSARIGAMREEILALIAHLEALIDFPEDDVEEITAPMVTEKITSLLRQTEGLLAAAPLGRILRDGLPVAIIGKPNVGKSSLLNMLAGEDRAIVTDTPGTTRDSIETTIELDGILLRLTDTAGIRETDEPIEKIGVARAKEQAEIAELIWAVFDGSRPLDEDDEKILSLARIKPTLVLINKSDLPPVLVKEEIVSRLPEAAVYEISAKNSNARRILTSALHAWVGLNPDFPSDIPLVAEETQEEQLRQIAARMRGALQAVAANLGWDFVTVDLRSAWEILGEISGETVPDEIIDQIFARFCIGK